MGYRGALMTLLRLVAAISAALAFGLFVTPAATAQDQSIRPFKVQIPQAALDDLKQRIRATRWPDKETVDDRSQGAKLAELQELVKYWGSGYDWRKLEA